MTSWQNVRQCDGLSASDVSVCLGVSTLSVTAASAGKAMVRYTWICLCIPKLDASSVVDELFKPKSVVTGLCWTVCELSCLISVYWHFEFWAFPSCMEWWSEVYCIILIAMFSGSGLFIDCTFLEVRYFSPDRCTLMPFHSWKCELAVSHDFSLTKDVVSIANAMNGLKNLTSPAANSSW